MTKLNTMYVLLRETADAWSRDKGSRLAAALAYYTVFSLTPLLIIIISITGLVFGERAAQDEIANQLEVLVGYEAADMIQTMLANFENPTSGILTSIIGLGTMIYGATGLFYHVQGALNTIWHVEIKRNNGFVYHVKQRFIHLAIIFGVGAVLLLTVFAEIVFTAITEYLNMVSLPQSRSFFIYLVMVAVLFAVLYKILPETKTAWRDVAIGAAVTSTLFNIGKFLIGVYMRFSNVGSAFGTAGSLVALLVWVYYSAQIFLLGAEFTHVFAHRFGSLALPNELEARIHLPATEIPHQTILTVEPEAKVSQMVTHNAIMSPSDPADIPPQTHGDDASHAQTLLEQNTKKVRSSTRIITVSTVIGTLTASVLGVNWLHKKRKKKRIVVSDRNKYSEVE